MRLTKQTELEKNTLRLNKMLESLEREFESIQNHSNSILSGNKSMNFIRKMKNKFSINKLFADDKIIYAFPVNTEIDITEDNKGFNFGWHPPEKNNFRWAGKDYKNPVLYFKVFPLKHYELEVNFFVPYLIADKPIKVFVNNIEVETIKAEPDTEVNKKITISPDLISSNYLKIHFESGFWTPNEVDHNINDKRILSLAFNKIKLKKIQNKRKNKKSIKIKKEGKIKKELTKEEIRKKIREQIIKEIRERALSSNYFSKRKK